MGDAGVMGGGSTGTLTDSGIQTITGAKTFLNQTLKRRNPANTLTLTEVHPAITADSERRFYQPYSKLVKQEGSTYYVIDGTTDAVLTSSTNPVTAITYALNNLTSGRTAAEKVLLIGDFVCGSTIPYPSLFELELIGRMKLADGVNAPLMLNAAPFPTFGDETSANRRHHIYIHGGEWDGNRANNNTGGGYSFLAFQTCKDVWIENVFIHDTKGYAVIFEGCWDVGVRASHFKDNGKMGIAFDGSSSYGIGGKNCLITHCISEGADINGIWGHGYGDEDITGKASYGFVVSNCIVHNCFLNIYLDERLWGYSCVNNFSYAGGDGATAGGGIFINGENDGVPYFHARYSICSGNVLFRNISDGIELAFCSYLQVSDNLCVENNWDGIAAWGCHDCDFIDNQCFNNNYGSGSSTFSGIHMGSRMGETIADGPKDKLYPLYNNRIVGNRCQDWQATKTQTYGVHIYGVAFNNEIRDNWVESNKVAGIKTTDLSRCYDNIGFKTKRGRYHGIDPTESAEGFLSGIIQSFQNAGNSTIAKTIDSSGTRMLYTTSATTNNDTCGGRVVPFTERDQFAAVRFKFRHTGGGLARLFLGWSSNTSSSLTTVLSPLNNFSGAGLFADGQSSANWRILVNSGDASTTNTDSTVVFDGNAHEVLIMFNDTDAAVLFVLDRVLLTGDKITTDVPAAGTDLGLYWAIQTQSASAAKVLEIWDIETIIKGE